MRWKAATVAELDTRIVLGPSAQVWYGAAWIRVPKETELEFHFQSHPMTHLRWFLNNQRVQGLDYKPEHNDNLRLSAMKTLVLRPGWNQVMFRGYCVGYPPFRAGMVLDGPAEKLWNLRLSAAPPREKSPDGTPAGD